MAFTLEDGSGVAGANAYIDAAYFRTHHTDRGNSAGADFIDNEVEAGIIRASLTEMPETASSGISVICQPCFP